MKRFLLFWIFILMVLAVLAQGQGGRNDANGQAQRELNTHVTAAQAMDVGYAFMHTGSGSKRGGTQSGLVRKQAMQLVYTGKTTDSLTRATTDCYYVFALQPKGFVIVAADERVNPILGYSYDNDFVVENMPDHVRGWLGGYEKQIKTAIDRDVEPANETTTKWSRLKSGQPMSNTRNGNSVGPLLTTTWNQGQYYNNLCPADANGPAGHVYTGCVATAMAQIINYHQYPQHGRGTHSYESNYGTLTVNYGSANYDYTNMPDALTYASNTTEVDAVATLMRDCGVAVNMGYAADESGSFDVEARAALINFFRYSPNMSYAEKAYFTNDEWETMLRNDLDAGNPVYYSGQGTGGHAFVCDGYNADGYFSFNFGWGGYCNGWYLTSNVNPGGSTFNDTQSAIFGIAPDSTGNVILGQTAGTSTFTVNEPLEFYHLMGHNAYEGGNYENSCNSTVNFVPVNSSNQIVADIMDFEDQSLSFYDGDDNGLRELYGGASNDLSPVVSDHNMLRITYDGYIYYAGFKLIISQSDGCRMVSNIGAFVDTTTVHLTWTENGTATQWQIEYGVKDFELGTGTVYTATTNTVTLNNLTKLTEYDFYIRSICGENQYGQWNKVSAMIDGHYWQDIVTSQPEGYVYDAATNSVQISTAEQLTWWAKTGDGIDGHLAADIDLSGYKWQPTALSNRNFNGHGHIITNMYVLQGNGFFSGNDAGSVIENLGMTNGYIKSNSIVGGLCGDLRGTMRNCYVSNSVIEGDYYAGGLVYLNSGLIVNCYVNAEVIGSQAGLLTCNSNGTIRNCYATGKLKIRSWCYNAGIAAVVQEGEISNCYSIEVGLGVVGFIIGTASLTNLSTFESSGNVFLLSTPIVFDDISETDLLSALNRGVESYNDSEYCSWTADTDNVNGGYPVFGNKYVVQCSNLSDLSAQNTYIGNENVVVLNWIETGNASQWCIRYRRHDRPDTAYTFITTTSNPDTLHGIPFGYTYDFNVRAICDANHHSGWGETQTVLIDLPFWTDIVTSQPVGYVEDADGNVEIYSAEGLAWLAVKTNGMHNQQRKSFYGKTVTLKSDINLEAYRWYPIGNYVLMWDVSADTLQGFSGTFDGQNHTISNIYMNTNNEHASGLFGFVYLGIVKNVILNGGLIIGGGGGGLIDYALDCYEINNCHSSVTVHSNGREGDYMFKGYGGSLFGKVDNSTPYYSEGYVLEHGFYKTIVSNCSASGTVYGINTCGDLIGLVYGNVDVRNCYATGNVNISIGSPDLDWLIDIDWRGGLVGFLFFNSGSYNCFSIGRVENCSAKVIGMPYSNTRMHYLYGQDYVNEGYEIIGDYGQDHSNLSEFHHDGNTNALLSSVSIDGTVYSDLLDALNAWVISQNDSTLRMWVLDTLTGYPVFGDYFVPSCNNPAELTVTQATQVGDATIKTRLSWTQEGEPDHWEILYVAAGQLITSGNFGTIIPVNRNPCVLAGIPVGQHLDFYVRAVCDENNHSGWCGPVTYIPDKLHWTEVVTSQPEGFQEDGNGNVYISSAEGLSWLASIINGLNGQQYAGDNFIVLRYISQIILTRDIDLSAYRWTSIGDGWQLNFNLDGNNHVVSGMCCNETSGSQGLFGKGMFGEVKNLSLIQCYVYGDICGAIAGGMSGPNIINCLVKGTVRGGGLVGEQYGGNIENSCFIGSCSDGISAIGSIANCYAVGTNSNNDSKIYYGTNNVVFSGSGTTWTLNTPAFIDGSFHTDLLESLNAWVDVNNTDGRYLRWVADSNMVNGGYPVFESVSLPAVTAQDTVVAQGYYSWHGMVFTSDTVVTDTLYTLNGYDSVVTYHIFVNPASITEITVDNCSSYVWNGQTYSETGDYVQTFLSVNNVDSVVILHLSINPLTGVDEHFSCDSYTWIDSVTYVANNNTATYTLQTTDGCDSVVTLHLTIGHKTFSDTVAVACNSFDWYEQTNLTQSGDYTRILTNANGCDSVVTLHLTINYSNTGDTTAIACDVFDWYEHTGITQSCENLTHTFTNAAGCDSVVTLHLTIVHPVTTIDEQIACDSFTWIDGNTYTESTNEPTITLMNAAGCDSVVTLHLTIGHPAITIDEQIACESFTWIDGNTYTESTNEPTITLMNAAGCDSVLTLHLTINHTTYGDTTAFAHYSFDWYEHTGIMQSCDNLTHTFTNAAGCDSIVTLHLTINTLYWTDVVTSQPEGYQEDENGNVYISSAEGLSWLSSVVNGLNGAQNKRFNHIVLTNDIDLSAYLWKAIGDEVNLFQCASFNGNNHIVSGLNCHESSMYQGLFGYALGGTIHNLILTQCEVQGGVMVGIIAGLLEGTEMYNCKASGNVSGSYYVGGIAGFYTSNMENSCFIGMIDADDCSGGICGAFILGGVVNCYAVNETAVEGMITGTCYNPDFVSNCYYKENGTNAPITSSECVTSNNSGFTGVGTTWTLSTPPYINGIYHTDLVEALNAWVDANNTDGRYCRWVADTAMVNGGYPLFEALSYPVVHDTLIAHESYSWHGMVFTSDTVLADTILTSTGYFNVLMHHLLFYHPMHTAITVDTCDGYSWGGTTYNTSGDYTYSHLDANGCTQVDTLHLTVRYSTTGDTTAVVCNSFDWYEYTGLTQSGVYTHTFPGINAFGCDSVVTLHLTVNHPQHESVYEVAYDSYQWNGETYNTTGVYTYEHLDDNGCMQVDTLHLTVYYSSAGDIYETACETFTWNNETFAISGEYERLFHDIHGADSVVTLHLTVNHPQHESVYEVAYDSYQWNGETYNTTGVYTYEHLDDNGCMQVDTLHLTVYDSSAGDIYETACETFTWNNETFAISGEYERLFHDIHGADSVVTLHLTINNTSYGDTTAIACDSFDWYEHTGITQSCENLTHTFTNAAGCDSVVTLHLTINKTSYGDTTVIVCDSLDWYGTTYTQSGDYYLTLTNTVGCDSVVTLHLTISHADSADFAVTACESYEWNGEIFTTTGDYTRTLTCANGCDSIVTLHLTIHPAPAIAVTATETSICVGGYTSIMAEVNNFYDDNIIYSWSDGNFGSFNDFFPNSSGSFTFTVTATHLPSGCASTGEITINVNDNPETPVVTVDHTTIYDGGIVTLSVINPVADAVYTWYRNGVLIAEATSYVLTDYLTTMDGVVAYYNYSVLAQLPISGCVSSISASTMVTVNPLPVATVIAYGNTVLCEGGSTTLHVNVSPYHPSFSYQWYVDDVPIPGATGVDYVFTEPARLTPYSIYVMVSANGGYTTTAYAPAITVVPAPMVTAFISDNAICEGSTATLTAWVDGSLNPNYDYQWFRSIPGSIAELVGIGATYTTMGNEPVNDYTYWVQVTSENGCSSQSNPIILTVNPSPYVILSGNTEICFGNTATLYANVVPDQAATYVWYKDGGSVIAFNTPFITVTEGGTYTVEATVNGCQATENITINVSDAPETPVVMVDHTTIYDGGIVTLSVINPDPDPLTSYTWYRNGEVIPGATQTIIVDNPMTVGGETTSYVYTVVASHLFSSCAPAISASVVVTVSSLPVATVTVYGNTVLCEGSYVTLHVDVSPYDNHLTYSYQWYEDGMLIPGATSADYNVIESGRTNPYNFMVMVSAMTGGFNITAYAPAITVLPAPMVTAFISDTAICEGSTATLTAWVDGSIIPNYDYQWFRSTSGSNTELVGIGATYTTMGDEPANNYTYWVLVSSEYGCSYQSDPITLTINPPTTGIDVQTACGSFTWIDGITYTESTNTATYTLTNAAGCDSIVTLHLTIHPTPAIAVTATETSICVDGHTTIMAEVNNLYDDNIFYSWSDGNFGSFNDFSPNSSGSFTFTVTATHLPSGCASTGEITINVNDNPETPVVTVDNALVYDGGIVTLSVINPVADAVYTWYRNGVLIAEATNYVLTDYLTTIDGGVAFYSYSVRTQLPMSGCVSNFSASTMVAVNPLPVATVTVEGNTVLCEGGSVMLHVDVSPYDNLTYSYQWYVDGVLIPGATSADYNVIESARANPYNFMVMVSTMTGGFNITAYAPAITVLPAPMVTAFISDTAICEGSTATLTAWVDGGLNPNYDYQWFRSTPGSIAELVGIGATYTTMGDEPVNNYTYWVQVTSENGCSSQSNPITLTINQPTTGTDVQTACGSFTWIDGVTYTESNNTATYTLTNAAGCDSVVTLNLTINQPATGTDVQTACGSFTWIDGVTYTESNNTATYTLTNAAGCDSVVTLNLTINQPATGTDVQTACGSFTWIDGVTYTESNSTATFTLSSAVGCDSIVTLHLTVNHASTRDTSAVACGSFTWYGTTYTQTGDYTRSLTNAAGCDSTVTLHLTINPIPEVAITGDTTICPGSGTLLTATGADSYMWSNYSTDASMPVNMFGVYSVIGYTSAGCYNTASVTVLVAQTPVITVTGDLELCTGNTGVVTAHGGISYVWSNGSTDSSLTVSNAGTWQVIGFDENGCNSMTEVSINVWQPATTNFSATACNSYTWNDSVYTQSGDYSQTLQTVHGCDSVVTLHLTVNNTTYGDTTVIACNSFDWYEHTGITQSCENLTHTFTNSAGCDSIVTLHLTVNAQWQVDSYDLNVNQVTGGTITMTVSYVDETSPGTVNSFSTTTDTSAIFESWIQLSAVADYGYDFVEFLVITASGDTLETSNNGFTMPAENVTVTAVFTLHNFNITVNVSDETPWGTVSGSGSFAYGSTDTLTATPLDEHHIFVGWSDYNTENPRVITVTQDSTITAYFVPEEIEIIGNDTVMGSVSVNIPGGGHLTPNTPIVITAIPEPHYHFVSWSDGNTDNPRTIFPMQAIGLTAVFAIDQHTITVLSNDNTWGEVIGGGIYDYGTEISICANALAGYEFLSWGDGNTNNPRYITVEQDSLFTAIFQLADAINDAIMSNVTVYSYANQIVVVNAEGFSVEIFDMSGRLLVSEQNISQSVRKYTIATNGIYLVKVGNSVFKKVKIAR